MKTLNLKAETYVSLYAELADLLMRAKIGHLHRVIQIDENGDECYTEIAQDCFNNCVDDITSILNDHGITQERENPPTVDIVEFAKDYGFFEDHTGGGCTALTLNVNNDLYIMITDDAQIPTLIGDQVDVGIYSNLNDQFDDLFFGHLTTKEALSFGYWVNRCIQKYIADADFSTNEIDQLLTKHNLNNQNAWTAIQSCVDAILEKGETP
jgi:hypothetical protein